VAVEINQGDSPLFRANKIILSYHVPRKKTSIEAVDWGETAGKDRNFIGETNSEVYLVRGLY
jgi:hypothetical protein